MAIKILSDNQSAYLIKTETLTDQRKRKEKTVQHLSKQNNIFSQWINAAVLTLGVCGGESHHSNILNLDDDKGNKSGGACFRAEIVAQLIEWLLLIPMRPEFENIHYQLLFNIDFYLLKIEKKKIQKSFVFYCRTYPKLRLLYDQTR